jgi:hypothetical protein
MANVYHVVLLKLKAGADASQVDVLFDALEGLKRKLPGMRSFVGGPYASPEGLNKGFTHGFVITFADAQTRDAYLEHPEHEEVKQQFLPYFDDVIAFDFTG